MFTKSNHFVSGDKNTNSNTCEYTSNNSYNLLTEKSIKNFNNVQYIVRCVRNVLVSVVFSCGFGWTLTLKQISSKSLSLLISSLHSNKVKDGVWGCFLQPIICLYRWQPTLICPSKKYYTVLLSPLNPPAENEERENPPKIKTSRWVSSQSGRNPGTYIVQEVYLNAWSSGSYPALTLPWAQTQHLRVGEVRGREQLYCRCWFDLENEACASAVVSLWLAHRCIPQFGRTTSLPAVKIQVFEKLLCGKQKRTLKVQPYQH